MRKHEQSLESSNACAEYRHQASQDIGFTIWTNQYDTVSYQRITHHTLSLYINGGHQTRRLDQAVDTIGGPNKLCLMPAESLSAWNVKKPQRFAHIYFSKNYFKELVLQDFDIDPHSIELEEKTFFTDSTLIHAIKKLLDQHTTFPDDTLMTQEAVRSIIANLAQSHCTRLTRQKSYRGRLSKSQLLLIDEFIAAHLDQAISIDQLAELIHLSPFHLMRVFKKTMGISLHQKVMKMRLIKASELLRSNQSQLTISTHCGFAHQSHFSRCFRQFFGVTPKQYQVAHHS